jgi:pimeloyl-ACP methyl ester carboxylesterase
VSLRRTGERFEGQRNDNALMLGLRSLPLADVRCPTLLVSGTADPHRAHAEFAAAAVRDAELRWFAGGGHRGLWLNDDWAEHRAYALRWLREHTGEPRKPGRPGAPLDASVEPRTGADLMRIG